MKEEASGKLSFICLFFYLNACDEYADEGVLWRIRSELLCCSGDQGWSWLHCIVKVVAYEKEMN